MKTKYYPKPGAGAMPTPPCSQKDIEKSIREMKQSYLDGHMDLGDAFAEEALMLFNKYKEHHRTWGLAKSQSQPAHAEAFSNNFQSTSDTL